MTETVVVYAGLGVGHLAPMVELANLFPRHGLAVTVVLIEPPAKPPSFAAAVSRSMASNPRITFHVMPSPSCHSNVPELIRAMNAPLREYLRSSVPSARAVVFDMFCACALDVAAELGLPAYFFQCGGASHLAVGLHLPHVQAEINASFGEIGDEPLLFPSVPPFKPSDLPKAALDRNDEMYRWILGVLERLPESRGILVNTFQWLETKALRALGDGACVVGRPTPPVCCVGPLVSRSGEDKKHGCLSWLDAQPEKSVVFLCFGSMGSFPKEQLAEIAIGLERSGQRFLWVVRRPHAGEASLSGLLAGRHGTHGELDIDELMPEGFLERTKGRGLAAGSWAPQADVLRHRATGAFVTHCGWNSRLNKVFIVEEVGVGAVMAGYDGEVVRAEEVEAKVRWMLESNEASPIRERVALAKERAEEATRKSGSSHQSFVKFLIDFDVTNGAGQSLPAARLAVTVVLIEPPAKPQLLRHGTLVHGFQLVLTVSPSTACMNPSSLSMQA
uniref:Glycosyltransferase n=1 Tax=Oryza barthii TaxID=65489 RepID=A0A0D3GA12_9ORYZ